MREEKFKFNDVTGKLEMVSSVSLGKSDYTFMSGKVNIHRYKNSYDGRTTSLHLYVKPIKKWNKYDLLTGQVTECNVDHDSWHGMKLEH